MQLAQVVLESPGGIPSAIWYVEAALEQIVEQELAEFETER